MYTYVEHTYSIIYWRNKRLPFKKDVMVSLQVSNAIIISHAKYLVEVKVLLNIRKLLMVQEAEIHKCPPQKSFTLWLESGITCNFALVGGFNPSEKSSPLVKLDHLPGSAENKESLKPLPPPSAFHWTLWNLWHFATKHRPSRVSLERKRDAAHQQAS